MENRRPCSLLYNTSDPRTILYNAASSSLRTVIGSSTVDEALTDGRTKIINDIRENLVELEICMAWEYPL